MSEISDRDLMALENDLSSKSCAYTYSKESLTAIINRFKRLEAERAIFKVRAKRYLEALEKIMEHEKQTNPVYATGFTSYLIAQAALEAKEGE